METVIFCWNWISTANPELLPQLMDHIVTAWIETKDARLGLFAAEDGAADGCIVTPADDAAAGGACGSSEGLDQLSSGVMKGAATAGGAAAGMASDPKLAALLSHHLWLGFFMELWFVCSHRSDSSTLALMSAFHRLFESSLASPFTLSAHPASVGARFRLLFLALKFCLHGLQQPPGTTSTSAASEAAVALGKRLIEAGLDWFARPPSYFASVTRSQVRPSVTQMSPRVDSIVEW